MVKEMIDFAIAHMQKTQTKILSIHENDIARD